MRYIFGKTLADVSLNDDRVYVVAGDIGFGIFDNFRKNSPDRFINFGTIEQSMISIASGMALKGLRPWVYTITPFLVERAFEQIKIDISAQNVNVKLVGYCDYPEQGITHMDINSTQMIKSLPNIKVYEPTTKEEVESAVIDMYKSNNPGFLTLKKLK
jgi:transketolase